jgi:hypothetical protein
MDGIDEAGLSSLVHGRLNQKYYDLAAVFKKRSHPTPESGHIRLSFVDQSLLALHQVSHSKIISLTIPDHNSWISIRVRIWWRGSASNRQTKSSAGKPSVLNESADKKATTPVNVKSLKCLEESDKEEEDSD